MSSPPLVLWDLDGTIISAGSSPGEPFERALRSLGGEPPPGGLELHGKTDLAICRDYLQLAELSDPRALSEARTLLEEVERVTAMNVSTLLADRRVLPGVVDVLAATSSLGVRHALATGNSRARAQCKLMMFDMLGWFNLALSAFGDETTDRAELLRLAGSRCLATGGHDGEALASARLIVVGDTPTDVLAARVLGFPVVGVSTGVFSDAELLAAGADLVVSSLAHDIDGVVRFVLR